MHFPACMRHYSIRYVRFNRIKQARVRPTAAAAETKTNEWNRIVNRLQMHWSTCNRARSPCSARAFLFPAKWCVGVKWSEEEIKKPSHAVLFSLTNRKYTHTVPVNSQIFLSLCMASSSKVHFKIFKINYTHSPCGTALRACLRTCAGREGMRITIVYREHPSKKGVENQHLPPPSLGRRGENEEIKTCLLGLARKRERAFLGENETDAHRAHRNWYVAHDTLAVALSNLLRYEMLRWGE